MSEYIPRLRDELVAAAAREHAGTRRRAPRTRRVLALAAAAAVLVLVAVLAVRAADRPTDERPALPAPGRHAVDYRVTPLPGADAADAAQRSAAVLRERLAAAGVKDATVAVSGDRLTVEVPPTARATVSALAVPGRLGIYDWEAGVLGADGRPAPATSGLAPGTSQYEAVRRAAKAQASGGPPAHWLVDDAAHEVLAGPRTTSDALGRPPEGARMVEVPGGVRVVQAAPGEGGGWYALDGVPALGNGDIASARAAHDPAGLEPVVAFDLTPGGRTAFAALTRELAHRGREAHRPGNRPDERTPAFRDRPRRPAHGGAVHQLPGAPRRDRRLQRPDDPGRPDPAARQGDRDHPRHGSDARRARVRPLTHAPRGRSTGPTDRAKTRTVSPCHAYRPP
jgi:hypothetical protein